MNLRKIRGFTLIEILTVICIIIILIGLLQPALRRAREQAYVQEARAMIGSLEVAINMYYTDTGSYPTAPTLSELMDPTINPRAPYMDSKDYDTTTGNFTDPWDNAYEYVPRTPSRTDPRSFVISSWGPDETTGTTDDIEN